MQKTKFREVLFFASYCGPDSGCSDKRPCPTCLGMSNVYEISMEYPVKYKRELAPHWLTDTRLRDGKILFPHNSEKGE